MLAIFGGTPRSSRPLEIVRPSFPRLAAFADPFQEALDTGRVTNNGRHVQQFEAELSAYIGAPTLAFSSGQAALMTMLAAADLSDGEVILPSYTFAATPHAVNWSGARPVFADIDPVTMTLDPGDVARRVTSRTKAIVGVCAYGVPCDYDGLGDVARRHGLQLFFDSAPAFGSARNRRPVGAYGGGQIFSFHATKAFATMEGGALSTRDPDLYERARALRNFGQHDGANCRRAGLNGKMMELPALIGSLQLTTFAPAIARRLEVAARYRRDLDAVPGLRMAIPRPGDEPIWLYFPLIVDQQTFGIDRDQLCAALAAENIKTRKYFEIPCHLMDCYKGHDTVGLDISEHCASGVLALPVYNDQTDDEIETITEAIVSIHEQAHRVGRYFAGSAPGLYESVGIRDPVRMRCSDSSS